MKQKCKICGANSESEYCFRHKQKKALKSSSKNSWKGLKKNITTIKDLEKIDNQINLFLSIWNKRSHKCENCNKSLGNEPLSYMFDHILEKSKYPELKLEENNIWLLCLECHDNKTRSNLSKKMEKKIKIISKKFGY